jgi:hypothetical protein
MADKTKVATLVMLALLLTSCATGQELRGTWTLTIGRDGTCRTIEHQAESDQLSTSTRWRGEGCGAEDAVEQSVETVLDLGVPNG